MKNTLNKILTDIKYYIGNLTDYEYSRRLECLSGASIGEHTRHCLEMISELFDHAEQGVVCYDNRKRDKLLQNNVIAAEQKIDELVATRFDQEQELILVQDFQDASHRLRTNGKREMAYHIEHCIHHQAIIKIGAVELKKPVGDQNFGVAFSTRLSRAGHGKN